MTLAPAFVLDCGEERQSRALCDNLEERFSRMRFVNPKKPIASRRRSSESAIVASQEVERQSDRAMRPIAEEFPIIRSKGARKINPTKEQLDEAMFG